VVVLLRALRGLTLRLLVLLRHACQDGLHAQARAADVPGSVGGNRRRGGRRRRRRRWVEPLPAHGGPKGKDEERSLARGRGPHHELETARLRVSDAAKFEAVQRKGL
jgi:hypothetical protein